MVSIKKIGSEVLLNCVTFGIYENHSCLSVTYEVKDVKLLADTSWQVYKGCSAMIVQLTNKSGAYW